MRRAVILAFWLGVCLTLPGKAVEPQRVQEAVDRGVKWLLARQKNGNWEEVDKPDGLPYETKGAQWGGLTAISTYALLSAGQDIKSAPLDNSLKFLKKADIKGTYALGLRCQVWGLMAPSPERQQLLLRDAALIRAGRRTGGEERGHFDYFNDRKARGRYDHSTSNYAVLGLWTAAQNGVEVPLEEWQSIEEGWKRHQAQDGSWGYVFGEGSEGPTMSMTSAGVATLFITQDHLHSLDFVKCGGSVFDPAIGRGGDWMTANFDSYKQRYPFYTLYNIERVGSASGLKYFGTIDWYGQGAEWVLGAQNGEGSWGSVQDTCFAILFLVRGRAPVAINKLDYTPDVEAGKLGTTTSWNERPRDAAHISRWIGQQMEQEFRWQIVNLKSPESDLHEAPILYIAGKDELKLGTSEEAKLKQWVEQGGMILGNADCERQQFAMSFRRMGERMFPGYKFRELPLTHPIYDNQQFNRSMWKMQVRVLGLSNGVRELMLIPETDLGKTWQTQGWRGATEAYAQFAADVFQYGVDKKNLRKRGQSHLVIRDEKVEERRTIRVARLSYPGNWDPEPWGWKRLAIVMHNDLAVGLQTVPMKLGEGKLDKSFAAAHLTGTGDFKLSTSEKAELRSYVQNGGCLIVDAAGGDGAFAISAENEIGSIFAPAKAERLKPEHPAYRPQGVTLPPVAYRAFALKALGKGTAPRIKGVGVKGRIGVFLSPEDLSAGLVGQSVDGVVGYEPGSATLLMERMLMYAAGAAPATAPLDKRDAADLTGALEKWGSVWTVSQCGQGDKAGHLDEWAGQKNVLVTYPIDGHTPCTLSREIGTPPRRSVVMHLNVSSGPGGEWELLVKVDGSEVTRVTVSGESWHAVDVDLAAMEGKRIKIELVQARKGSATDVGYWGEVRFEVK